MNSVTETFLYTISLECTGFPWPQNRLTDYDNLSSFRPCVLMGSRFFGSEFHTQGGWVSTQGLTGVKLRHWQDRARLGLGPPPGSPTLQQDEVLGAAGLGSPVPCWLSAPTGHSRFLPRGSSSCKVNSRRSILCTGAPSRWAKLQVRGLSGGWGLCPVPGGDRGLRSRAQHQSLPLPLPYVFAQASGGPWAPPVIAHPPLPLEVSGEAPRGLLGGREGVGRGWAWWRLGVGSEGPGTSRASRFPSGDLSCFSWGHAPPSRVPWLLLRLQASLSPFASSAHPGGGGAGRGGRTRGDQGGTGLVQIAPEQALGRCPV